MGEFVLKGKIERIKELSGKIEKTDVANEVKLPEAAGLSEFVDRVTYATNGADMTAVGEAIAEKAGVEKPAFPEGWKEAVEGIKPEPFVSPYGVYYYPEMVLNCKTLETSFKDAEHLKRLELTEWEPKSTTDLKGGRADLINGSGIEQLILPKLEFAAHFWFRYAYSLKEVQLGSIGNPVLQLSIYVFSGCTQKDLRLTIFVDATTLAGIPSKVLSVAPFGATNATIVYRNSTTGEVITE